MEMKLFKSAIVSVLLMICIVGAASASNVIGSGQLCQTFTAKDQGRVSFCTPIIVPIAFASDPGCHAHFDSYTVTGTASSGGYVHLADGGTAAASFQDVRSFVKYSCTANTAPVQ